MKIAEQMKADVVDVANNSLTLQYANTLENIETLTSLLRPYGIKELVRTEQSLWREALPQRINKDKPGALRKT